METWTQGCCRYVTYVTSLHTRLQDILFHFQSDLGNIFPQRDLFLCQDVPVSVSYLFKRNSKLPGPDLLSLGRCDSSLLLVSTAENWQGEREDTSTHTCAAFLGASLKVQQEECFSPFKPGCVTQYANTRICWGGGDGRTGVWYETHLRHH